MVDVEDETTAVRHGVAATDTLIESTKINERQAPIKNNTRLVRPILIAPEPGRRPTVAPSLNRPQVLSIDTVSPNNSSTFPPASWRSPGAPSV